MGEVMTMQLDNTPLPISNATDTPLRVAVDTPLLSVADMPLSKRGDLPLPEMPETHQGLVLDYPHTVLGCSVLLKGDSFEWLSRLPENSLHAIVTDPPYGVKEYEADQIQKRDEGVGGVWRIPPAFDGNVRAPMPRFTALNAKERESVSTFFLEWSRLALRALRPGAHVFVASNSFLSQLVFSACVEGGLEFRGEMVRLVRTLRGGDRPKGAEEEFPGVCSLARGCYEPWGIFRKPMPTGMTVSDCLREWGTGGLRRTIDDKPFSDVLSSERTPRRERDIADHPSIKPQSLMRQIVHAALPLGEGVVADPFAGSGSTLAAAESLGYQSIGVERHEEYYQLAIQGIPKLASLRVLPPKVEQLELL
jgi:site-specific DNA-methyltransferase (adenine-specific)